MRFVLGRQECALVVVEPPRELRCGAVFEIDDDILILAKHVLADALARLVRQSFILDHGAGIDVAFIEP